MGNCQPLFMEISDDLVFCLKNFQKFHPTVQAEIIRLAILELSNSTPLVPNSQLIVPISGTSPNPLV